MLSQHEADTLAEARKVLRDLEATAIHANSPDPVEQYHLGKLAVRAEAADQALMYVLIHLHVTHENDKARAALGES